MEINNKKPVKRYFIAFTFFILYMVLHYFNQLLAVFGVALIQFLPMLFSPGNTAHVADYLETVLNNTEYNAGWVLAVGSVMSLLLFLLIMALRGRNLIRYCKLNYAPKAKDVGMGTLLGFSANFILSLVLAIIMTIPTFAQLFEEYADHISILTSSTIIPSIIGIGILGPIVEEVLFRGMITVELSELFPLPVAITVQGILFGIYHGNPVQAIYAALLGLAFGYCAYKSDSIYPAITAHIAMNTTSLIISLPAVTDLLSQTVITLIYALASATAFVFSLIFFIRKRSSREPLSINV